MKNVCQRKHKILNNNRKKSRKNEIERKKER